MKTWFTGDTHFRHANIILYSGRPFVQPNDTTIDENGRTVWKDKFTGRKRAEEHDECLIKNHNALVGPEDVVYHVGDFCFGDTRYVIQTLRRLKFKKYRFIWGNHDSALKSFKTVLSFYPDLVGRVEFLGDMAEINVKGQAIVLTHYGMRVWNRSHYGTWNLYGHSHGSLPDDPNARGIDVGVDCHNYSPISFEQIQQIMAKKTWKPIDHHGQRGERE